MKFSRIRCLLLCLGLCTVVRAQTGGRHAYAFLDLVPAPRVAAMGGALNALADGDVTLVAYNPAALNAAMHRMAALSYVDYIAGIRYGYATLGWHAERLGTFAGGVQYVDYGSFTEADENGIITGSFSAAEYALQLSYGRSVEVRRGTLQAGMTLKPVWSQMDDYHSFGVVADLGLMYSTEDGGWNFAAVVRNAGTQIKTYAGRYETMPIDVQLGAVRQFRHAPVRVSVVLQHLEDMHLREEREFYNEDTGMMEKESKSGWKQAGEEAWRHVVCGLEFFPFEGFWLRAGYNPLRRDELAVDGKKSTVGFSWGAGLNVRSLTFAYASARYHLAGAVNLWSLQVHFK